MTAKLPLSSQKRFVPITVQHKSIYQISDRLNMEVFFSPMHKYIDNFCGSALPCNLTVGESSRRRLKWPCTHTIGQRYIFKMEIQALPFESQWTTRSTGEELLSTSIPARASPGIYDMRVRRSVMEETGRAIRSSFSRPVFWFLHVSLTGLTNKH